MRFAGALGCFASDYLSSLGAIFRQGCPIWQRWDESGREALTVMPTITKSRADLKSQSVAPVTALASRDRVDVPTVKRRARRRSDQADAPAGVLR